MEDTCFLSWPLPRYWCFDWNAGSSQIILLSSSAPFLCMATTRRKICKCKYFWSQTSVIIAYFFCRHSFTDSKNVITWWRLSIHDCVMSVNLLPSGKLLLTMLLSLSASLFSFALSSKINSKLLQRWVRQGSCKIHHMDKTCIKLSTFEEFATAALQTT